MRHFRVALGAVLATTAALLLASPASTATASGGPLQYVSLGDSYSAGFGLTPFSATSPFTATAPTDPNGCFQAEQNWPHRVADELGLALDDQSCSGAITANLGYPAGATMPTSPTIDTLPELPGNAQIQTTMTGQTAPRLQTAALSANTDIVTVAIGGNDLGFTDLAAACIRNSTGGSVLGLSFVTGGTYAPANCADYFTTANNVPAFPADANLQARMSTLIAPRIAAVFEEIAAKAPNAQVFVVGYPQIASSTATDTCFSPPFASGGAVPFSAADIHYLDQVESWLNDAVKTAATAHRFSWVSMEESTTDHNLCSDEPWINNIDVQIAGGATCPAEFLPLGGGSPAAACIRFGALHPNEDGVANLAIQVQVALEAWLETRAPTTRQDPAAATVAIVGVGIAFLVLGLVVIVARHRIEHRPPPRHLARSRPRARSESR